MKIGANDKVRVGIIGCGGIANGKHLPALKQVADVEMVAFCDLIIEKAEKAYDAKKTAELEERLKSNKFTLQDFYDQMVQLKSMGSMQDLLAQMPGVNMKNIQLDEKAMGRTEAIILSMTPRERENPNIIGASRKKRIASGSGVKVEDVNRLLKSFDQMRSLMKQFTGPGAGKKMKRMRGLGGFGGFPGF